MPVLHTCFLVAILALLVWAGTKQRRFAPKPYPGDRAEEKRLKRIRDGKRKARRKQQQASRRRNRDCKRRPRIRRTCVLPERSTDTCCQRWLDAYERELQWIHAQ
jgi:hypothetical protein